MSVLKIKDQNNDWIQIPTIKGEKGDPFTYADFTTEQLESLKGKDGISPTVSVASDTSEDYRLSFTDETHTVTTPNLIPEAEKIFSVYPTDTASGSIASFPDGADNIPLKSCIVRVEPVQEGSGDPSPDNVRPISGWTGCEVQRTGVNVWDEEWMQGDISGDKGEVIDGSYLISKNFISVIPSTVYHIMSLSEQGTTARRFVVYFYDKNKNFIDYVSLRNLDQQFTVPANCHYIKFRNNIVTEEYNHDISINYPATDHDYHPYTGQTYPITFPSEVGTIYGAYVDVINGELVVDGKIVDLETFTPSVRYVGDVNKTISITLPESYIGYGTFRGFVCSTYAVKGGASSASDLSAPDNKDVGIYRYSNVTKPETKTVYFVMPKDLALNGELVFFTTVPQTYPLIPTEIKTLLGQNNVWADTGDTSVTYRADTTLYISRLTEPDADMIADANITSGSYFMVGNNLYRATANIASGASVIVGTNATKISLAQALNEINA